MDLVTSILLYDCETWILLHNSEKKGSRLLKPIVLRNYSASPIWNTTIVLGAELWVHVNFHVGPHEPLLKTFKRRKLAWLGHVTRYDIIIIIIIIQNRPSGHPGGWTTPWSAEEMLNGQFQRVLIPARARTARKDLLQKRLEEDL